MLDCSIEQDMISVLSISIMIGVTRASHLLSVTRILSRFLATALINRLLLDYAARPTFLYYFGTFFSGVILDTFTKIYRRPLFGLKAKTEFFPLMLRRSAL